MYVKLSVKVRKLRTYLVYYILISWEYGSLSCKNTKFWPTVRRLNGIFDNFLILCSLYVLAKTKYINMK